MLHLHALYDQKKHVIGILKVMFWCIYIWCLWTV